MSIPNRPAAAEPAKRTTWAGVDRGPLAPKAASDLEHQLLEALSGYQSFYIVDAAGHALGDRALAQDAQRMGKLLGEGIRLLLNLQHKEAIERLDLAIALFESQLTPLRDYELLEEALLAKATAQFESGLPEAASSTLTRLAALKPTKKPNEASHKAGIVEAYAKAEKSLGQPGILAVRTSPKGASIRIDGEDVGTSPLKSDELLPGKHYVVARWPSFTKSETVIVNAGKEAKVKLSKSGPADDIKRSFLEAMTFRRGVDSAESIAKKLVKLSTGSELLAAAVRRDGKSKNLFLMRHAEDGKLIAVARVELSEDPDRLETALKRLIAALFIDGKQGEFEITESGAAKDLEGLEREVFGGRRRSKTG